MSAGDDVAEFRSAVRTFMERLAPTDALRALVEKDQTFDPAVWGRFCTELGAASLLVSEEAGGAGFHVREAAVVAEEAGRVLYGGPYLAQAIAGFLVDRVADGPAREELMPGLLDGTKRAAVVLTGVDAGGDDSVLSCTALPVDDVTDADLGLVVATTAQGPGLFLLTGEQLAEAVRPSERLDLTRDSAVLELDDVRARRLDGGGRAAGIVTAGQLAALLLASESVGAARATLDVGVEYSMLREQFGRKLASFQAVKHTLADLFVTIESTTHAVADAVGRFDAANPEQRQLLCDVAQVASGDAFVALAHQNIQNHGGIGFTWEHDAHLYYRRAISSQLRLGGRGAALARLTTAVSAPEPIDILAQGEGGTSADAEGEALSTFRKRAREFFSASRDGGNAPVTRAHADYVVPEVLAAAREHQRALHEAGLAGVTYPVEYGGAGLGAEYEGAVHDEAKTTGAGEDRVFTISIGMIGPALVTLGTEEQKARHIGPILRGEDVWCELFSEPGAGSDMAGARTTARRDGDHFVVTGQKVWTSYGRVAKYGALLARTDPDAPKHKGLTMFIVDMESPGITLRPLRQITGEAEFNEVFLDEVRVPADATIGGIGEGWTAARAILMHERLNIGTSTETRMDYPWIHRLAAEQGRLDDVALMTEIAEYVVRETVLRICSERVHASLRKGEDPGPVGSVTKMVKTAVVQEAPRIAMRLLGNQGVAWPEGGDSADVVATLLRSQSVSIAGGTDNIQRNIIGERILGLPRDGA